MARMKILVTGGAGFIGSNLVEKLLDENYEVVVIDNLYKNNNFMEKCKSYLVDIRIREEVEEIFKLERPDVVVHLAALAGVRKSFQEPSNYINTNIKGLCNILEAMKRFKINKIIFASSSSVYGNCKEEKFSEVLTNIKPISPYACTKLAGEQLIYTYNLAYGISAVCLRFFTVYGANQRKDLAIRKFMEAINKGEIIKVYGDGSSERDYTYIDDVVEGIIAAINYNKTSYEIINIGGGNPISLHAMITTIQDELGKKAIIHRLPMQMGDVDRTCADISKASELLNWQPKVTFKEGIKRFRSWLKI